MSQPDAQCVYRVLGFILCQILTGMLYGNLAAFTAQSCGSPAIEERDVNLHKQVTFWCT